MDTNDAITATNTQFVPLVPVGGLATPETLFTVVYQVSIENSNLLLNIQGLCSYYGLNSPNPPIYLRSMKNPLLNVFVRAGNAFMQTTVLRRTKISASPTLSQGWRKYIDTIIQPVERSSIL